MNSFLRAEWKTILAVFLFCGAIFGYFYHQELEKIKNESKEYTLTCIQPGQSVLNYHLNHSVDELDLSDFTPSSVDKLGVTKYTKSDGSVALHVRDHKIVSIEYDLTKGQDKVCGEDFNYWKISPLKKTIASAIRVGHLNYDICEGAVVVQEITETEENVETRDIGIIVVNI